MTRTDQKLIKIGQYTAICETENTRYGFRHLCNLYEGENIIASSKACYYNRTWESYEYESVINTAINRSEIENKEELKVRFKAKAIGNIEQELKTIANIAALGEALTENKEQSNKWKERMLKAGLPQLQVPKDFHTLPEEEQEKRLNAVIKSLKSVERSER